ncbi:eukaryotic translation initiation factor 3, subunit F [Paraphysoderma sedebokerense]|nr:eukaryotic translation initiation factor 3, subunit F [Paraphysoderma sedebokerense]
MQTAQSSSVLRLPLQREGNLITLVQSQAPAPSTIVSPVVLFSILDHYIRRDGSQEKVVGALLGVRSDDGSMIEIRNSFPIPYSDNNDIFLDIDFTRLMYQLHRRVNNREVVVGWYSTGNDLSGKSAALHDWFESSLVNSGGSNFQCVHLAVDTELTGDSLGVKAFMGLPVGYFSTPENSRGRMFVPVTCDIKFFDAERTGLDAIAQAAHSTSTQNVTGITTDIDNLEAAVNKLIEMVDEVSQYVDNVLKKLEKGGNTENLVEKRRMDRIGRFLSDLVGMVPKVDGKQFEKKFNGHLQDLLMVVYLANLTRTQLDIADRLQSNVLM